MSRVALAPADRSACHAACHVRSQNAVRLHHLADETAASGTILIVRARTVVHLRNQERVYMPVWTDLFDPELPEARDLSGRRPMCGSTADLPIDGREM
jgi:hypothetical protein